MNQTVLESKQSIVSEIQEKLTKSSSSVIAEYRGLSVEEVTELRRKLRAEGIEFKVYKNTLASRAAEAAGFADLNDYLTGPNAIAFAEDETSAARVLAKFAGGIVEGAVVTPETIKELSALPNREGMLSMLLSVLNAPVSGFARVVNAVAEAKSTGVPVTEEVKEEAAVEAAA